MTTTTIGEHTWLDIEPYLDRALDLSGDERREYLCQLTVENPGIAAAVREMLQDRDDLAASGFLENSVTISDGAELVGRQIGAYTIDSLLGRGGMGEVWLAHRSDGRFEGRFAIKFLDSYSASPAALDRFRREGRLLARLAHPNIARLLDAGVSEDDRPYLVLEYVEGVRIDEHCKHHALAIPDRARLLLDVLSALAHAHGNLVVHRDIKPSNVLVTADGTAKLLDFGIAKLLSADPDEPGSVATRVEETALTPDFAAPEQLLGESASTATDVYQVGVLMFVLFAGRLPIASTAATRAERIREALDCEAPRLSSAAEATSRKALRGDLDAITAKALRKRPAERYATAAALADDLRRYLADEPVAARENLLGYRMRKFVRRHRAAVVGTLMAAAALVAVTIFAVLQMHEAQIQRDQSRAQAKRAQLQAQFVTLMMSTVGNKPTTAEQLVDAGAQLLDKYYTDDLRFRAAAMLNLSGRYGDLGLTKKQLDLLVQADSIAHTLDDPSLIATAQCGLTEAELDLGHMNEGVVRLKSGKSALARIAEPDPLVEEDCAEAEAVLAASQGDNRRAIQIGEKALALLEQAGETHDVRYPALLGNVADYYKGLGDVKMGFKFVNLALSAAERNGLGDTDSSMIARHNVASALQGFGEFIDACTREKDVVEREQSTGRDLLPAMAVLYGGCLRRMGDPAGSLPWFDRGLRTAQSENQIELEMHVRGARARALIEMRRFADARADLDWIDARARQNLPGGEFPAQRAR